MNEKLNLQRSYIKKIRAMLFNWEKNGLQDCQKEFAQYYPLEKGFMKNKAIPPFENVLMGKILFLGMVRGKNDSIYLKYQKQLKKLIGGTNNE